jgi:hypothetical protein
MSAEFVANEDLLVKATNTAFPPGGLTYQGDTGIDLINVVPTKSTTCQAAGKFMCTTGITLTWVPPQCMFISSDGSHTLVSGAGAIAPAGTKVLADNQLVLRANDVGACGGTWIHGITFVTTPCVCSFSISVAGQTKVLAE